MWEKIRKGKENASEAGNTPLLYISTIAAPRQYFAKNQQKHKNCSGFTLDLRPIKKRKQTHCTYYWAGAKPKDKTLLRTQMVRGFQL